MYCCIATLHDLRRLLVGLADGTPASNIPPYSAFQSVGPIFWDVQITRMYVDRGVDKT